MNASWLARPLALLAFAIRVMERMAESIGYRGGRFIKSPNPITAEQIVHGGIPSDVIFLLQRGKDKQVYGVPYRALMPGKIDGLLVIGKSSAGGRHLGSAHTILFQGHAAGVAAAQAVKDNVPPRQVDIRRVQETLRKSGVVLSAP